MLSVAVSVTEPIEGVIIEDVVDVDIGAKCGE